MSAPVPRGTEAVLAVVVSVIVLKVPSPVVWILADGHDCTSDLLVELDTCGHVLRNHYGVYLVSVKIDGRLFCLLDKSVGLRFGCDLLVLGSE